MITKIIKFFNKAVKHPFLFSVIIFDVVLILLDIVFLTSNSIFPILCFIISIISMIKGINNLED